MHQTSVFTAAKLFPNFFFLFQDKTPGQQMPIRALAPIAQGRPTQLAEGTNFLGGSGFGTLFCKSFLGFGIVVGGVQGLAPQRNGAGFVGFLLSWQSQSQPRHKGRRQNQTTIMLGGPGHQYFGRVIKQTQKESRVAGCAVAPIRQTQMATQTGVQEKRLPTAGRKLAFGHSGQNQIVEFFQTRLHRTGDQNRLGLTPVRSHAFSRKQTSQIR